MSVTVTLPVVGPRRVASSVWRRFAPAVSLARSERGRGLVGGPSTYASPGVPLRLGCAARRPLVCDVLGRDQSEGPAEIQIP